MRKLLCLAVAVLIVAVFSSIALAQQDTGGGPEPGIQQEPAKQLTPEQFSALKSRVLAMIENRKVKLNEEKACVEAAATPKELRKCRPAHPMGPGGRHRGPGERPPMEQQQ